MLTLAQLLKPETRDEIVDTILSVASTIGLKVTSWQTGQPVRTVIAAVGQKMADFSTASVEMVKGAFGDLASGDWLPLWAKEIYDVDQVPAAPAVTSSFQLVNASGTQYDLDPGELIVAHATSGKTYRNTAFISILASSTLSNVTIQSDELGTANDAAPGTITVVVSTLPGVTCTNVEAALGADAEGLDALRLRTRRSLSALSPNGPKDAYNYVVTTPSLTPTSTPITRARTTLDELTDDLTIYIATATGAPIPADVTIATESLQTYAEPWTVNAVAAAATPVVFPITYHVWLVGSNLPAADIELAIANALGQFFATFPIGGDIIPPALVGSVDVDAIRQVIGTAVPNIKKVSITVPAADTPLAANEVPQLGTITPTVTLL